MVGIFKFIAKYIVFGYKYKFLFPKKLNIKPNQNSTKAIKGKEKTLWWEIKKTQYQNTYLLKKTKEKPSTLIRVVGTWFTAQAQNVWDLDPINPIQ